MPGKDFNTTDFRNTLGSFATGVTMFTALGTNGPKFGITANSFNSASLDPAMVLWSTGRDSNCFEDPISAEAYAINTLKED